jgi:hypothetical protein
LPGIFNPAHLARPCKYAANERIKEEGRNLNLSGNAADKRKEGHRLYGERPVQYWRKGNGSRAFPGRKAPIGWSRC